MTVLVTGGAGYIGSHMVYALVAAGEKVVVLDNLSTGFDWAIAEGVPLVLGETGDQPLVAKLIKEHGVEAIIHFAASIVVPDSVSDPLGYYKNNTVNSRALIECAVKGGVKHFIFSSTAAVYGDTERVPVTEDDRLAPMSPYGSSKLMTEIMLRDASAAHGLGHVILRYFNVAGADPELRTGQSTKGATHLIKVAVETALGRREKMDVFGTDYPTRDGTCIRDYIHVSDLAQAHLDALRYLRNGGASVDGELRLWARLFGERSHRHREAGLRRRFPRRSFAAPAAGTRRRSLRPRIAPARCSAGSRSATTLRPSCATRSAGSAN